jgi:hypothetical protein
MIAHSRKEFFIESIEIESLVLFRMFDFTSAASMIFDMITTTNVCFTSITSSPYWFLLLKESNGGISRADYTGA